MEQKDNGGPAFPTQDEQFVFDESRGMVGTRGYGAIGSEGMTLRDYFAAKAMQGLLASEADPETFEEVANFAYKMADAMISERSK